MCWHECLWPIRSFSFSIKEHDEQPSVSTWCFSDSANRDRSWGPSCRCKNREEDYYHLLCSLFFSMKRKSSTCCRLLFLSCLCGRVFCHQPKLFVRSAPCVTMECLSLPFVVLGLAQDSCLGILVANCFDAARKLTMNVIQMAWNTNLQVSLNINLSKEKGISLDLSTVCTVIDFVRAVTITAMGFFFDFYFCNLNPATFSYFSFCNFIVFLNSVLTIVGWMFTLHVYILNPCHMWSPSVIKE